MRTVLSSALAFAVTVLSSTAAFAQPAGLTIVVIEGEDAVNIIRQGSAVAPIVEVRDRNNLPVAGVSVVFAIGGGTAAFAGGSTAAVTTDATGRATAAALTPTRVGSVHINVTATYQGQTTTATISQTNFATVADATRAGRTPSQDAGAAAAAAGGGVRSTAGTGGGKSSTLIAALGGAAAGGAVIAAKVLGGSSSPTPPSPTPPSPPAPQGPTSFNLAGAFSGNLTATGTASSSSGSTLVCNFPSALTGSLRIAVTQQGSSVNGTLTGSGTITSLSTTCGVALPSGPPQPIALSGPIAGTPASLEYSQTVDMSGSIQGLTSRVTYRVSGSLSAGVFSGTLTVSIRQEGPGVVVTGSTTMPLTLR